MCGWHACMALLCPCLQSVALDLLFCLLVLAMAMSQLQIWNASPGPPWVASLVMAMSRQYTRLGLPTRGPVLWRPHLKQALWNIILAMLGLFHHGYVNVVPMICIVHDLLTSTQDLRVMAHMTLRLMRPTLMRRTHGLRVWAEGVVRIYLARCRCVWPALQCWSLAESMDLSPEELNPGRPWSVSGGSEPDSSDTDDSCWDEWIADVPMNLSGDPPQFQGGA